MVKLSTNVLQISPIGGVNYQIDIRVLTTTDRAIGERGDEGLPADIVEIAAGAQLFGKRNWIKLPAAFVDRQESLIYFASCWRENMLWLESACPIRYGPVQQYPAHERQLGIWRYWHLVSMLCGGHRCASILAICPADHQRRIDSKQVLQISPPVFPRSKSCHAFSPMYAGSRWQREQRRPLGSAGAWGEGPRGCDF